MKLKNIKLLKTLAVTGALGLVAAVPVITATACSSDTSNSGGNTGGGSDTGGSSGGGSSSGGTQSKVTPELKDNIKLIGGLATIYDGKTDTNTLLANAIKGNLDSAFTNASELKDKTLDIKVDGGFTASTWDGDSYDNWSKNETNKPTTVLYDAKSPQINISSLNDLKTKLSSDVIKTALTTAGQTVEDSTTFTIKNKLGLTNEDLIHVNVIGTKDSKNTYYDLQIPTSDINLDISKCDIQVSGNDVNSIDQKTEFVYDIGIDSTTHFTQPTTAPNLATANISNANEALVSLGMAKKEDKTYTLDTKAISTDLCVFNCTFSNAKIQEKAQSASLLDADAAKTKTFTITLTATPNKDGNYSWIDGTNTAKDITFDATFTITA